MIEHEQEEQFDDSGASYGVIADEETGEEAKLQPGDAPIEVEFDDMDTADNPPYGASEAEAKLKIADMIVRPKGKFNLRQMSRVSPQEEKAMILLELQTEAQKLLTGQNKKNGDPLLLGDMILDISARYSRARDGSLIVDALKVIQIENEKDDDAGKAHWG